MHGKLLTNVQEKQNDNNANNKNIYIELFKKEHENLLS